MSEGQAGTETRRWTIYVCRAEGCDLAEPDQYTCPRNGCPRVRKPGSFSVPVEVVEASDPEGTAREALADLVYTIDNAPTYVCSGCGGDWPCAPSEFDSRHTRQINPAVDEVVDRARAVLAASGGTRPAFTDELVTDANVEKGARALARADDDPAYAPDVESSDEAVRNAAGRLWYEKQARAALSEAGLSPADQGSTE